MISQGERDQRNVGKQASEDVKEDGRQRDVEWRGSCILISSACSCGHEMTTSLL